MTSQTPAAVVVPGSDNPLGTFALNYADGPCVVINETGTCTVAITRTSGALLPVTVNLEFTNEIAIAGTVNNSRSIQKVFL